MSELGRADLLRALLHGGQSCMEGLADRLGYLNVQEQGATGEDDGRGEQHGIGLAGFGHIVISAVGTVDPGPESPPLAPVPILKVLTRRARDRAGADASGGGGLTIEQLRPRGAEPVVADVLPWAELWSLARRAVAAPRPRRRPMTSELVDLVARCQPLSAWRPAAGRQLPGQLRLVLDRSDTLMPLWSDQERIAAAFREALGCDGLTVDWVDGDTVLSTMGGRVAPGAPTVTITGWSGPAEARDVLAAAERRDQARGLRGRRRAVLAAGCTVDPITVGLPTDHVLALDESVGPTPSLDEHLARWVLELVMAVPAFVEPGLLRDVRAGVPSAGPSVELQVWRGFAIPHPDGARHERRTRQEKLETLRAVLTEPGRLAHYLEQEPSISRQLPPDARARKQLQEQVESLLLSTLRRLAARLPEWRRAASSNWSHEDCLAIAGLFTAGDERSPISGEQFSEARRFVQQAACTNNGRLREWLADTEGRAHGGLLDDPRFEFLREVWGDVAQRERRWWLAPAAGQLELRDKNVSPTVASELRSRSAVLELVTEDGRRSCWLERGRTVPWPTGPTTWSTDVESLEVEPFEPQPWMSAWGQRRDAPGHWVEVGERFERVRFLWNPPADVFTGDVDEGRYVVDGDTLPAWTSEAGIDEHGAWADIAVRGVTQRMRWIPPGSFRMGSPEDEWGRFDNEVLHDVELTAGFWLGDTPCTRDFYEAVTGRQHPGRSGGPEHPVTEVSWEGLVVWLAELEAMLPGLGGRLPTEAEWEYACRAGDPRATYVSNLDSDQRLDEFNSAAWFESSGTHKVRGKLPNSWGLHDMLGNAWEWCHDWHGAYDVDQVSDPRGPDSGVSRVLRGGSWIYDARYCRAAIRNGYAPGYRDGGIGFRLARGQGFQSSPGGAGGRSAAEPQAERDARRRRVPRGRRGRLS